MALFNPQTAREAQRKSVESRRTHAVAVFQPPHLPQPPSQNGGDEYVMSRLALTRGQISRLDGLLERANDAKEIKSLADAIARLVEIEFCLAGRPKPGSLKPRAKVEPARRGFNHLPPPEPAMPDAV